MKEKKPPMDAQFPQPQNVVRVHPDEIVKAPKKPVSRRDLLKLGMSAAAASTLAGIDTLAWQPARVAQAAPHAPSDIQFDIGNFIAPAQTINGVQVRFGPVFTLFLTARLNRTPNKNDQDDMSRALNRIEDFFSWSSSGAFTFVSYGLPYFRRLPGGLGGSLVSGAMPRLLSNNSRFALEEAVAAPTDVTATNGITKANFNVRVAIETNDICFTIRSDSLNNAQNIANWLQGSNNLAGFFVFSPNFASNGLVTFTTIRTMFQQNGLPRQVADQNNLPFRTRVNPQSPMWMGFADQQVSASGPASICTFQGNASARFTNATSSSYFSNGSIQHLSHVIQDLGVFYADDEPFLERVQYMFRSDPIPSRGNADQFTNGGGPAFLPNDASVFLHYRGLGQLEADQTAKDPNTVNDLQDPADPTTREPRMGHVSALQISSRAADGTPIHIRMDGAGFSSGDVPNGTNQGKLQFTVFVPTADFFRTLRANTAALKYQIAEAGSGGSATGTVPAEDNGLERFLTATRRQNFLIPPRRHRSFPLLELT
jgi:hypothetical protein